jgi:hypothetical protein
VTGTRIPKCHTGDPRAALGSLSERASVDIVKEQGSGVESYRLQDGVWLEQAPVLVSQDFDFAMAMALEGGIGAGLAAKQRADRNRARAAELAATALSGDEREALDGLRACGVHRWALLWGGEKPRIQLVTEHYDAQGKRTATELKDLPATALGESGFWQRGDDPSSALPP